METATTHPSTMLALILTPSIHPNPWNKKRPLDAAFLASVREKGILSPILVRPLDREEDTYEVICGERRLEAALDLGLPEMPALVREMGDEEAQLLTLIENTHREDMTPWQQAQLIGELLARDGMDIAAAAAATGWSEGTIRRRAKLLELSPSWKAAMEAGDLYAWTVAHFEILAVFDEKRQEELHKDLHYRASGFSVADLKEEIAERSTALKSAPWDLDDVTLAPKAGACTGCPKRSDTQADLFGEVPDMVKAGASCLDEGCFKKKGAAFTQRKADAILEKHPEAIKVSTSYYNGPKGALQAHETTEAKKGDKGAVPALVYGDGGKVSLGYVKVKKTAQEKEDSPRAKAKEAEKKRQARIEALALEKLVAIIQDPDTEFTDDAPAVLLQFCLVEGLGLQLENEEEVKRIRAFAKKPVTLEELWEMVADRMKGKVERAKWGLERGWDGEEGNEDVALVAWMVSADLAELRKEAEAEIAAGPEVASEGDESADLDEDAE